MTIHTRPFGRTGHASSRVIFGAAGLGRVSPEQAERTLETLLVNGVNHVDVAASYGNGEAEKRLAPWLATRRRQFFLATKTLKRTGGEAREDLLGSLERLQVDRVDLIQVHNLTDPGEWQQALGPGGAVQGLVEAREQGLTRFIGVTGHGYTAAEMHLRSLDAFPFDAVLLPYNYLMMQDPPYARSFAALRERCRADGVALQTIKAVACAPRAPQRPRPQGRTWYRPLEDEEAIRAAVGWVLGDPEVFLVSCSDILLLPRLLEAAGRGEARPTDAQMAELARSRRMQPIFRGRDMLQ